MTTKSIKQTILARTVETLTSAGRAAMILLMMMLTTMTAWAQTSGNCGTTGHESDVTWSYNSSSKTLTISGTGEMGSNPWSQNYRTSIKKVVIYEGVTTIFSEAFYNCDALTEVTIPSTMTTIGVEAFYGCDNLATVSLNGGTTIGMEAFSSCSNLVSINIPNSVTSIDESAFYSCLKLETINIGSGLTSIAQDAFGNCQKVKTITVDGNNTAFKMKDGVLFSYDGKTLVIYPRLLEATEYSIPAGVTIIRDYAFEDCLNLTSVTIPAGVTTIGDKAFSGCYSLTSVTIPDGVTTIGDDAFYFCSQLATITIPASVTTIGGGAFEYTSWIDNQSFEDGVLYVNHIAVASKNISGDVTIKSGTTAISNYCFNNCEDLTSVTIPASLKSIGNSFFYNCSNLVTVTFAEDSQLESIGAYAFEDCDDDFTYIVIPAGVTSIGEFALNCRSLYYTYMLPSTPPTLGEYALSYNIVVPAAAYNDYKNSVGWESYSLEPGYTVTCGTGITTTNNGPLVEQDETVTLSYNNGAAIPEGKVLKATYGNGNDVALTQNGNTYSFNMPASDVNVALKKDFMLCTATVPDQSLDSWNNMYYKFDAANDPSTYSVFIGETVKDGETVLTLGTDYTFGSVTFADMTGHDETDAPSAVGDVCQVEIIGKGEYIGTKTATFTIVDPNGTWGDLAWSLENGMLTISGTGAMNAADNYGRYPWGNYCADVTSITIGDGVTSIANHAFGGVNNIETYSGVKKIIIPASVTSIGADAFKGCTGATDVYCYAAPTNLTWADNNDFIVTDVAADKTKCHVADASAWSGFKNVNVTFVGDLAEKSIPYIDADGNTQYCTNFTMIDGSEGNYRDAGWYVVKDIISKDEGGIDFYDEAHIILADDASLTLSNGTLEGNSHLTIYGQAKGNGTLNATRTDESGIMTMSGGHLTINGGIIDATGYSKAINPGGNLVVNGGTVTGTYNENDGYGLYASGTITISGGQVTANGDIYSKGNLTISGGQVTAKGWIAAEGGNITLGWTSDTDYISASQILPGTNDYTVSITNGQAFTNGTAAYTSATPSATLKELTNVTLRPITGVTLTKDGSGELTATLDGSSLTTLNIPTDVEVKAVNFGREFTEGTAVTLMLPFSLAEGQTFTGGTLYKFSGISKNNETGKWEATMTQSATLKANTPYLLMPNNELSSGNSGTLTIGLNSNPVTLNTTTAGESSVTDGVSNDWEFLGSYEERHWYDGTDGQHAASNAEEIGKVYGFAATGGKATDGETDIAAGQFVRFENGAWIRPSRCYLKYKGEGNPLAGARHRGAAGELPDQIAVRLIGLDGTTTAIGTLDTKTGELRFDVDAWYSLDGTRLEGKPTKKGLYINNGQIVVIK